MTAQHDDDEFSERLQRAKLPLLFATLLALILAARLDMTRGPEAVFIAYALPIVGAIAGASPFWDANPALRGAALGAGVVLALTSEAMIFSAFSGSALTTVAPVLLACVAVAIVCQLFGSRRGLPSRMTAWFSLVAAFAWYFSAHLSNKDVFGSVWGAFFVAFFLGGGCGLLIGEVGSRLVKRA
jgi:hypothetical protein